MAHPVTNARLAAVQLIAQLRQRGHVAYLAGGCVRDALMGNTPKDYDVATDATPEQVQAIFPKSAAVGAAFGVVIVYTSAPKGQDRFVTEVATFRAEGAYSDGRRPDEVRFTNAEEDASRRDFTINGLFAEPDLEQPDNPRADRIIDNVGGRADLEAGMLRAIGDPGERFGEDYLRMLRAVRFAARLGFEIEPKTTLPGTDQPGTHRPRVARDAARAQPRAGAGPAAATQARRTVTQRGPQRPYARRESAA